LLMSPKKILIVDDDDFMRETVGDVLFEKGYEIALAESGETAIQKYKEYQYDVILLDLKMQGIDGFQTFQEIKKINPAARAIIMTAYFYEEIITDCLREGAFGVLYKPLDMEKVLAHIEIADAEKVVLVVDEDEALRLRIEDILVAEGCYVMHAHDKEAALKQIIHIPPDIVIADISKEKVPGQDSCSLIRQIVPDVRCVIMVREKEKSDAILSACMDAGIHACMYKPFDLMRFKSNIKKVMNCCAKEQA
jgi:two-component system, NtrC family, response regulator HydG